MSEQLSQVLCRMDEKGETLNEAVEAVTGRRDEALIAYAQGKTIPHIRKPMPRKGGNSFYRDKNDYTKFCVTLCGAPVTDKDVDYRTAGTKKFRAGGWGVCIQCLATRDMLEKGR